MLLIGDPLTDHWRVIGVCRARQLIWVGDWSGYSSDSRVRKPEVQDALANVSMNLQRSNSILAGATV
jgi:hypothetical protein